LHGRHDWLNFHLADSCKPISTQSLKLIQQEALTKLDTLSAHITKNEFNYIKTTVKSSEIPCGKLLIKDHKTDIINYGNGTFESESRFVIPCSNFVAGFSKLGFKAIEATFNKNKITFKNTTIKNSYELLQDLEKLGISEDQNTITTFDVKNMYPNIKQSYIKTAIDHFSSNFSKEDKERIDLGWQTAKFGMQNVIIRHRETYHQFQGSDDSDPGLAIGSFESAFFSDLAMAYLFGRLKDDFEEDCVYAKIYRDDCLLVFRSVKGKEELETWHEEISKKIEAIMPAIKFKMDQWRFGLAFLDVFFFWDPEDKKLNWKTYTKPNAATKYLNKTSPGHTFSCTKAIPHAVVDRLARLTKKDDNLNEIRITDHYPSHRNALVDAGLCIIDKTPLERTFGQQWTENAEKPAPKKRQHDKRTVHFVSSFIGRYLKEPIQVTMKRLRNLFDVKWLHVRMCHKRFGSIENKIQGDLRSKVDKGVISDDYCDWVCNCGPKAKREGECIWEGGRCRAKCVIYKYKCLVCSAEYVGSTQQPAKKRLGQHCGDVKRLVYREEKSDKFAEHFAEHRVQGLISEGRTVEERRKEIEKAKKDGKADGEVEEIRKMVKPGLIWDGNGMTVGQSFGRDSCRLCNMEKFYIFDRRRIVKVMNQNNEFFGKCRHLPRIQKLFTEEAQAENGNRRY